jgi:phosphoribosyl 1,2-cyclic phosphodiesterase
MSDGIRFCPFASGSSGNCIFIGLGNKNYLVDAGLSGKRVYASMKLFGIEQIHGVFVTHEHSDHSSGVGVLARRFKIPVYATPLTWRYFSRHKTLGPLEEYQVQAVEPGEMLPLDDAAVTPFDIPHDAAQPVGYSFHFGGHKITVATDMGCVTDAVRVQIENASVLLLESNHDVEMLQNGKYPRQLKDRVLGERGHLSNAAAGKLLADAAGPKLRYTFLGHLSEENNRPLIALDTVQAILEARGVSLPHLQVADRHEASEMVEL